MRFARVQRAILAHLHLTAHSIGGVDVEPAYAMQSILSILFCILGSNVSQNQQAPNPSFEQNNHPYLTMAIASGLPIFATRQPDIFRDHLIVQPWNDDEQESLSRLLEACWFKGSTDTSSAH